MFKLQAFTTALNSQARLSQANLKFVLTNFFYLVHNIIVTKPTRCEAYRSMCKLYFQTWSKIQAGSKHRQTGITDKTKRNPRAGMGL